MRTLSGSNDMTMRKRSRWLAISIVIALSLAAGGVWLYREWEAYGGQLSTYGKISLGDSRDDVRYKMGEPSAVNGDEVDSSGGVRVDDTDPSADPADAARADTVTDRDGAWKYSGTNPQSHFDVYFDAKTGRTYAIDCFDVLEPSTSFCPALLGIWIGDSESKVAAILGEASRKAVGNGIKTLSYDDVGIVMRLSKQQVYGIQIQSGNVQKHANLDRFLLWLTNR